MVTVQLEEELEQLRLSHANISSELEKNKKLLSMQQTISDQYKKEVCVCVCVCVSVCLCVCVYMHVHTYVKQNDCHTLQVMMINKRMVNTRLDCQSKLKENNKLMEIKTSRIKVSLYE